MHGGRLHLDHLAPLVGEPVAEVVLPNDHPEVGEPRVPAVSGGDDKLLVDNGSSAQATRASGPHARVKHDLVGKLALRIHLLAANDTIGGGDWSTATGVDGRTLEDELVHRDVRVVALRRCQGSRDDKEKNWSHPEDCGEGQCVHEVLKGKIQTQVFKRTEGLAEIVA